ncbi:serine/threonine-protein phosphatase 2A regulatory subunit B'' subunit beta-like isoform X2 [Lineus longissimus]|uniref:serine/threonine-protein phosphatase 2A regulatory subunit B'' subunit beta-like isoform X2 n=1 Tax=Lineus longissimus TaxID=88925 RepID=UPI002B4DB1B1
MQKPPHAHIQYVYTRVTLFYNSCVDLKWQRAIHSCDSCQVGSITGEECGAIHYGYCSPVSSASDSNSNNTNDGVDNARYLETAKDNREKESRFIEQEKNKENLENYKNNNNSLKNRRRKSRDAGIRPLSNRNLNIPQFYFPNGPPCSSDEIEAQLRKVASEFSKFDGGKATSRQLGPMAKACGLPFYWKGPLFIASGGEKSGHVTLQNFTAMWKKLNQSHFDDPSRFLRLLAKPGCNYLCSDDFIPLIQDVVDSHPGLTFLQDAPEFHSRYVHTVVARIFFCVNRSWTGRIMIPELRRSNFLQVLASLEDEEDINQVTDFFSYEHFYVIYCKFWELDKDHDLFISKEDLAKHNDHAISSRMIDRIFSGAVTRGKAQKEGKMSYPEFVWFLIAEEDKRHSTSIEYWFRCMDLDGDGIISMFEMEYFYEEQLQKMEALGIETLPFEDILCQMLDLVKPIRPHAITMADLKACKMTNIFFDTFFNLEKYLDHEQRDPFSNLKDYEMDGPEPSDWEKYAAEEYEILVAEEGAGQNEDEINYEDDFEPEEDEELMALEHGKFKLGETPVQRTSNRPKVTSPTEEDIYDFSHVNSDTLGY